MANIITISFFDGGELNIPGTETNSIQENVSEFIVKYEKEYLLRALSYPLWKLFHADNYPAPATARFQQLLSGGAEWTDSNGHVHAWNGLNSTILSPIASYIWYWYMVNNATFTASTGEVKGKSENSTNVSVSMKQMRAYNEMSRYTECELWPYLKYAVNDSGAKLFPEFDRCQTKPFGIVNYLNI